MADDWSSSEVPFSTCGTALGLCGTRYEGNEEAFACAIDDFQSSHPGLRVAPGAPLLVLRDPVVAERRKRRDFLSGCGVLVVVFILTTVEIVCLSKEGRIASGFSGTTEELKPLSRQDDGDMDGI